MKILIVDDEPLAQQRLVQMVKDMAVADEILTANNGIQAIDRCQNDTPDIVLLDIRMPGMDGLEAAGHISHFNNPPAIIFITAYDEYALDAFKVHAVDYLLKPVRDENLKSAIERACQFNHAQLNAISESTNCRTNITAKISGNIKLIPVAEILYFQAEQKYVTVKYLNGETIIEDTLKELQAEFEAEFVRIHRNALVAKKFINGIHKDGDGKSYVTLSEGDKELEISRRHLSAVKKLIVNL